MSARAIVIWRVAPDDNGEELPGRWSGAERLINIIINRHFCLDKSQSFFP